jgi:hypothetical protein
MDFDGGPIWAQLGLQCRRAQVEHVQHQRELDVLEDLGVDLNLGEFFLIFFIPFLGFFG